MNRATRYAKRLRRAPAVGVLLNDGRVVPVTQADLKRLLPKLAGRA